METQVKESQGQQEKESAAAVQEYRKLAKKEMAVYSPRFRQKICESLLAESKEQNDIADQLIAMESQVRTIFSQLDPKTRAIVWTLAELHMLDDGQGIDYPGDLLFADTQTIDSVFNECSPDPQVDCIKAAHELLKKWDTFNKN